MHITIFKPPPPPPPPQTRNSCTAVACLGGGLNMVIKVYAAVWLRLYVSLVSGSLSLVFDIVLFCIVISYDKNPIKYLGNAKLCPFLGITIIGRLFFFFFFNPSFRKAMPGWASGGLRTSVVGCRPRFTFWLTPKVICYLYSSVDCFHIW